MSLQAVTRFHEAAKVTTKPMGESSLALTHYKCFTIIARPLSLSYSSFIASIAYDRVTANKTERVIAWSSCRLYVKKEKSSIKLTLLFSTEMNITDFTIHHLHFLYFCTQDINVFALLCVPWFPCKCLIV